MCKCRITRGIMVLMCFLAFVFNVTNAHAKVFEANDFASYKAAIDLVNAGAGGDTIKITGNIQMEEFPDLIKISSFTVTADVNADGTPKYRLTKTDNNYFGGIFCEISSYCTIENIIVEELYGAISVSVDATSTNPVIKINNCIATHNRSDGISVYGWNKNPKITISNCQSSYNKLCGIKVEIAGGNVDENPNDITIHHCVTNTNESNGMQINCNAHIYDCTSDDNAGDGFRVENGLGEGYPFTISAKIENCSARGNIGNGFITGSKAIINNCVAIENSNVGFYCVVVQATNCNAISNARCGFYIAGLNIVNNCSAINNGHFPKYDWQRGMGFEIIRPGIISNSMAVNNKEVGFSLHSSSTINCVAYNNHDIGIHSDGYYSDIYNSISYSHTADLLNENNFSDKIYNTVWQTDSGANDGVFGMKKYNCTTENPNLSFITMPTDDDYDVTYYILGAGSSARGLGDRSIIKRDTIIENIFYNYTTGGVGLRAWFESVVTNEYLDSIIKYDQFNTLREFNGDRYDAGSIAGNSDYQQTPILSYNPKKAANYGLCNITFYGNGFNQDTKITLKRQGEPDIVADTIMVSNEMKCNAEFTLHHKKMGLWDIVFDLGDTIFTIKNGFELKEYEAPEIEVEIIGPTYIRIAAFSQFHIKYKNLGNVDAYSVPILISINSLLTPSIREYWKYIVPEGLDISEIDRIGVFTLDDNEFNWSTVLAPCIPRIPANSTGYLSFAIAINGQNNDPFEITAIAHYPMYVFNADYFENEGGKKSGNHFKKNELPPYISPDERQDRCNESLWKGAIEVAGKVIPGVDCLKSSVGMGWNLGKNIEEGNSVGEFVGNTAWDIYNIAMDCIGGSGAAWELASLPKEAADIKEKGGLAMSILDDCFPLRGKRGRLRYSSDPNEKTGPVSSCGSKFFNNERDEFTYTINFENKSNATAPAAEVWIRDTLDLKVFDINTFEAVSIKIGNNIFNAPPYLQNYSWSVDMRPEKDLITKVDLTLDKQKGIATWYFKCIDPETGEIPQDALLGFLPPEDGEGSGQGSVLFTIKLKAGLPNDVVITNKAEIIFDYNEPIMTEPWVNKKDIVSPTSRMLTPSYKGNNRVELKWQGTDNAGGSGIYCYDVYVKQGNGEYEMLYFKTSATTAMFEIDTTVTYSFYTIATDSADNQENKTVFPDVTYNYATIGIKEINGLQNVQLMPNPANTECTLLFGVEKTETVSVSLSNMLGATVMKIYEGNVEHGNFQHTFNISSLPAGVYTVTINVTNKQVTTRKLVVIR